MERLVLFMNEKFGNFQTERERNQSQIQATGIKFLSPLPRYRLMRMKASEKKWNIFCINEE
jgi:hypothetical protein